MVETGHQRVREVRYRAPDGVEVLTLRTLRERVRPGELQGTHRPAFHQLLAVETGTLRHTVDFADHVVAPGQWLWVRPGQVQRWHEVERAEGTMVVFEAGFPPAATERLGALDDPFAPPVWTPLGPDERTVRLALDHLRDEYDRRDLPQPVRVALLRDALSALMLRLSHLPLAGSPAAAPSEVFVAFREAVERGFADSRRVEDYAADLAYSPRTLSRATLESAGVTAKAFVDRRVVLEAKRLLAHTDRPAKQIARDLGFSDAANFGTFFLRGTGETPARFRARG